MSNHTPGPWCVEADRSFVMVVAEAGGMPGIMVSQGTPRQRDMENALLIAAAPDLLAALVEYVERQEQESASPKALRGLPEYEQARAAIAKARGED